MALNEIPFGGEIRSQPLNENFQYLEQQNNQTHQALVEHSAETVQDSPHGIGSIAGEDYETGTWTPFFVGASSHTTQAGVYTRSGDIVTAFFRCILSSKSGISGVVEIGGLPFVEASISGIHGGAIITDFGGFTFTDGYSQLSLRSVSNTDKVQLVESGGGVNTKTIRDDQITDTLRVTGTVVYKI